MAPKVPSFRGRSQIWPWVFALYSSIAQAWIHQPLIPNQSCLNSTYHWTIKIAISNNSNDRLQKRYISVDVTWLQLSNRDATFLSNYRCVYTNYLSRHEMAGETNKWPEKLGVSARAESDRGAWACPHGPSQMSICLVHTSLPRYVACRLTFDVTTDNSFHVYVQTISEDKTCVDSSN